MVRYYGWGLGLVFMDRVRNNGLGIGFRGQGLGQLCPTKMAY